jgi:ABC-type sugar transport system ATPase subunit
MNIIIDLSNIMYNDLWMWNKTKLNIRRGEVEGIQGFHGESKKERYHYEELNITCRIILN